MSRPPTDLPERLVTADATDFERRLIEAREGHGLARTWEGWEQKAMGKP